MDSSMDARLVRIRKLLAKAEDAAVTAAEAEAFTVKAAQLMAAYGIDRAMLAAADPSSDVPGDRVIVVDAPYAKDKAGLLQAVAEPMRCRTVHRLRYVEGVRQLSVHLFGYGSDLQRVGLLYTSLLVQAANAITALTVPPWESLAAFRRSWLAGYATAIYRRLLVVERQAAARYRAGPDTAGGSSVALVLADRTRIVEARMRNEYPRLRQGRARTLSGSGHAAGYAAGQKADLGSSRGLRDGAPGAITR